jgi:hypothetical protein
MVYFVLIITTIALGLLSREVKVVPLWVGDVLWGSMVFYIVRFILINEPLRMVIIISLLFCYGIEFSQLYQAGLINQIRATLFGRLVLGSVFSWGDILSYTAGVLGATFTIRKL